MFEIKRDVNFNNLSAGHCQDKLSLKKTFTRTRETNTMTIVGSCIDEKEDAEVYTTPPNSPPIQGISAPMVDDNFDRPNQIKEYYDNGQFAATVSIDNISTQSSCLLTKYNETEVPKRSNFTNKDHCFKSSVATTAAHIAEINSEQFLSQSFAEMDTTEHIDESKINIENMDINSAHASSTKDIDQLKTGGSAVNLKTDSSVQNTKVELATTDNQQHTIRPPLHTSKKLTLHAVNNIRDNALLHSKAQLISPPEQSSSTYFDRSKKKRRSSIKRKLSKLHRRISTKLTPP